MAENGQMSLPTDEVYYLGFDIGGTFTDLVLWNKNTGETSVNKVLTTPENAANGVLKGITELLSRIGTHGSNIYLAIHGTTLITNALIERKGPKTALLTTSGHRDVLEIGTEMRYDTYDLHMKKPSPLVPRQLRFEIDERLNKEGKVLQPIDRENIVELLDGIKETGCESLAVVFLHSFKNPEHEQLVYELAKDMWPEVTVSLSSEIAPEIREYQRTSTTVANAYVQPISRRYLHNMIDGLEEVGYKRRLYLMQSNGGIGTAEAGIEQPIQLLESGPAAGALATAYFGRALDQPNLISFDMGGTTAKVSLIDQGQPAVTNEFEVGRIERFKAGSGLPVHVPVIEMIEIGAGGGSIAHVDQLGLLKVGPSSAGANPGPACYGFGGNEPTVTDANLVLGYLNPDYFLGGRMTLDVANARKAIREKVAKPLGLSVEEAAKGIYDVANENMLSAAKVHIAERGKDPRKYSMVAFGGAGPLHAHAIAKGLKVPRIIFPASAGVLSALGFLTAPIAFNYARSTMLELEQEAIDQLEHTFREMEQLGRQQLLEAGVDPGEIYFERSVDMRYLGQTRELRVNIPSKLDKKEGLHVFRKRFSARYKELYGHAHEGVPIQVITCRLVAKGPDPEFGIKEVAYNPGSVQDAEKGKRDVYFTDVGKFIHCPVFSRYDLGAGTTIAGPGIIEERESTVIFGPGMTVEVDPYLNLILHL